MVQPDVVDEHALRLDLQEPRNLALHADRDVAEADRAVPRVEERAGHDPDRVRKVHDPGVRLREGLHLLRDLEHDRHGAHGLGESTGARRLLADASAGEGDRLVPQPRRLAADAQLEEDERRSVDRAVEVVGDDQRPAEPWPLEHPCRHLADHRAAFLVDVVEDELVDRQRVSVRARFPRRARACTSTRRR